MNSYPNSAIKRLADVSFSLVVLPFALFLVVLGSIAILATQGSKVFFTQKRVGRDGKEFRLYKLRTLKLNANNDLSGMRKKDPDIIWVGWVLRAWRIDELPQIFNILKGDMSWVGPRPERPHIVAKCIEEIPNYGKRHQVLPGITGWAQIHDPNATPEENGSKLVYDLEYVHQASFSKDLKILFATVFVIFR
jgi:lipopolysaccharide/colanic/teichoic acid biosynthesis glycosyltransferase